MLTKNVCIVLRNIKNSLSSLDYLSVTDAFLSGGYCFQEIRLLSYEEKTVFTDAVASLKKTADNLAVVADRTILFQVREWLSELFDGEFVQGTLSGAGETTVKRLLGEAARMSGDKLAYNYIRKYDEDVVEIVYDSSVPKMLTDDVLRLLTEGLGDAIYALDDTPLEKRLVQLLKLRGRKICVAESFTGGGVSRRIVSVPGASEVYFEGLNTYDERSKIKRLGVSEYTLKTVGAVSDETAYEMAAGLIAAGDCDISVATTGLAGPKSDRTELPVGLCYIAVGLKEKVYVYRYRFEGTREEITETAINYALFLAYRQLKNI